METAMSVDEAMGIALYLAQIELNTTGSIEDRQSQAVIALGAEVTRLRANADEALREVQGLAEDTRPVLDELERLRAIKQRAREVYERKRMLYGSSADFRYILGEEAGS